MNFSISKTVCPPQTVAIIGGGFSGAMIATHLLSAGIPVSIKLIEKRPEVGRGIAYSTSVDAHLLNVPVGKMSAFPDQPEHFLHWLRKTQPRGIVVDADAFVPRQVYGDYIQATLREAIIHAAPYTRFERITEEAVGIEPTANGALIHLSTGESLQANKVVLATGNVAASLPAPLKHLSNRERYVREAWSWDAVTQLNPDAAVLLVGTGLTMADMVISLHQQGHRGPIYAVSRHGLLPQRHLPSVSRSACVDLDNTPITMRGLLQRVRQEIQAAARDGQDWRSVIDGLRPITQSLWQKLPLTEQQRFLRHVKSYWEVHRHRIAPKVANVLDQLIQSGQLIHYAGRIQSCQASEDTNHSVDITLRLRGTNRNITLTVERIINCTGAACDYRRLQHPLIASLQEQRLIRPSALAIGIETDAVGAVIDADGNASNYLYTIGTTRKASLWETTAVPELRLQAQNLAEQILQALAQPVTSFDAATSQFNQSLRLPQPAEWTFRQLFDRESCTYTYLIADSHSAILVDPVLEQMERDLQVLRELGLSLYACLETHIHADHITGAHQLRTLTGCQVIVPNDATVKGADRLIQDGEILQLGAIKILAIATPGHTDSHMAYLINGTHLLTGDALFIRGCGRTDFQGGDAALLFDAVTQKLFTLPDSTLVYPGHDYQGRTCSTIGEEKRWNPRFAGRNRLQFIQLMSNLNLPLPKKMKIAVPANERCGEVLQPSPIDTDSLTPDISAFFGMYI
ncbi:MBL fold metallo-hydrolase [Leptolyngbya sp. NK1-12]|uniref:MBL fold metallo-hydrolase n=1 Tax=Leptolyngbya sp. NK1-12 TaxID=2547451 RepID=A0AA96WLS1_9CYAN|nr:MBL fold metallo-hydrolase [Leptolyngbya sp. NK1-12]